MTVSIENRAIFTHGPHFVRDLTVTLDIFGNMQTANNFYLAGDLCPAFSF